MQRLILPMFISYSIFTIYVSHAAPRTPAPDIQRNTMRPLKEPTFLPPNASPAFTLPPVSVDPSVDNPSFVLKGARFTGNTVVTEAELQAIVAPLLGKTVTADDLDTLRLQMTKYYVDKGYSNSGIILPEQPIQDGVVDFLVVEGKIKDMEIRGTEGLRMAYVADRLWRGAQPPFNMDVFAEDFKMLLEDPLIMRMDARLRPGDVLGEGILDIEVERNRPYSLTLLLDNYNSPSSGSEQIGLTGTIRNLTGYGDAFALESYHSKGHTDVAVQYVFPFHANDTKILLGAAYTDAELIEDPFKTVDAISTSYTYDIGVDHAWINTFQKKLAFGFKLSYRPGDTTLLGIPFSFSPGAENGEMVVSAVRFSQDLVLRDEKSSLSLHSVFSKGLSIFGATTHQDGQPDSRFLSWLFQTQYAQRVGTEGASIMARFDTQLVNDRLLPQEQLGFGGHSTVRGYRENAYITDAGYLTSLEYRHPVLQPSSWVGGLETALFTDFSQVWEHGDFNKRDTLWSLGVGFFWKPVKGIDVNLHLARPLHDVERQDGEPHNIQEEGVHFQMKAEVF